MYGLYAIILLLLKICGDNDIDQGCDKRRARQQLVICKRHNVQTNTYMNAIDGKILQHCLQPIQLSKQHAVLTHPLDRALGLALPAGER